MFFKKKKQHSVNLFTGLNNNSTLKLILSDTLAGNHTCNKCGSKKTYWVTRVEKYPRGKRTKLVNTNDIICKECNYTANYKNFTFNQTI